MTPRCRSLDSALRAPLGMTTSIPLRTPLGMTTNIALRVPLGTTTVRGANPAVSARSPFEIRVPPFDLRSKPDRVLTAPANRRIVAA